MKKKVLVISCGGTIEKTYDEGDGSLANRESILDKLLFHRLRHPHHEFEINAIMHVDSLEMKDEHRMLLFRTIKSELKKGHPILVIHGTDTMDRSAVFIENKIKEDNEVEVSVPIVFTGAMKPFGFIDSDALQNVSEGIMACDLAGPGVYISFHGQLIPAESARKNHETLTFDRF